LFLFNTLKVLLPNEKIQLDVKHPELPPTRNMELDIWIPSLKLAFEYQREEKAWLFGKKYNKRLQMEQEQRYTEKIHLLQEIGIILIIVYRWWDEEISSLVATIHKSCPSLAEKHFASPMEGIPIPNQPPPHK